MSVESKKHEKTLEWMMGVILIISVTLIAVSMGRIITGKNEDGTVKQNETKEERKNGFCVVIDPGHGGKDPGKIGRKGTLEKDLNLQIGKKLKQYLEEKGYEVYLTRNEDVHLGAVKFRKVADLNERCEIINNCFAKNRRAVMVSIHQNSFEKSSVSGAQCFYYRDSQKGKLLAEDLQRKLNEQINGERPKKMKSNDNYYMLINSQCPGVIVECGFLSNPEEEQQLGEDAYQEKLAKVMEEGIHAYFTRES